MKKIITFTFFFVLACEVYSQHSNLYSQYMFNGLALNPAYAGSNKALDLTLVHRNQWTGFEGAPKTTSVSLHSPLHNKKLNVGAIFISDRYGVTQKNILNAVFAYRINFKKSTLSFGLQGGVDMTVNHLDRIITTDPGDAVFDGQKESTTSPVAGFGMYYEAKNYYVGASSPALIEIGSAAKNSYKPMMLNAGVLFNCSETFKIKPSVLMKYINHSPLEFDCNLNAYYKDMGLGFSYRTNDAVVFLIHYTINQQFSIGYSYDLTMSKLKTYNKGSHELMLKYEFGYKVNAYSPRYF